MQFQWNYYAIVQERSTGSKAFELLADPQTGAIFTEMGPNMMWNTKYSPMATYGGGMMGGMGGFAPGGQGPVSFNRTNPFLTPAQIATLSAASPAFAAGGNLVLSKMYDVIPQNRNTSTDVWRAVAALDGAFNWAERAFHWSV